METKAEGIICNTLDRMETVWERTNVLHDTPNSYCPGCSHSVVHRLLMEVVEELGILDKTIGVAPVGCSVFAYHFMNVDIQQAAHGRATAVATGIKRVLPNKIVFSYQGDGDLAAIGTAETIHTINRGENIVMIFINNGIYGMTGGQMAPTTLEGDVTSTTPLGRDVQSQGNPIKITEMIAIMDGAYYVTRQAVNSAKTVRKCKKAIKQAFQYQIDGKGGTSYIEVVRNCPAGWKMTPLEANKKIDDEVLKYYPLGDLKTPPKGD
ncbi:MAG: thiamine pyrophosphate-dependent enzyme [Candidatus Neomarinimicrobiota bacterium]